MADARWFPADDAGLADGEIAFPDDEAGRAAVMGIAGISEILGNAASIGEIAIGDLESIVQVVAPAIGNAVYAAAAAADYSGGRNARRNAAYTAAYDAVMAIIPAMATVPDTINREFLLGTAAVAAAKAIIAQKGPGNRNIEREMREITIRALSDAIERRNIEADMKPLADAWLVRQVTKGRNPDAAFLEGQAALNLATDDWLEKVKTQGRNPDAVFWEWMDEAGIFIKLGLTPAEAASLDTAALKAIAGVIVGNYQHIPPATRRRRSRRSPVDC